MKKVYIKRVENTFLRYSNISKIDEEKSIMKKINLI